VTFPPNAFRRFDEADDANFYAFPRRVVHIDDGAIGALTGLYERLVPPRGVVLDLMSSWRSHLPRSFAGTLIGLGMNRKEMQDNPQLSQALVHDLNRTPRLPFADAAFDAALCAVSVQYLTRPIEVFRDVCRTLRPGAPFVVSFSNRCFPDKAVALWHAASDEQHVAIVIAYFVRSSDTGGWGEIVQQAHTPARGDPLYAVWSTREWGGRDGPPHR
jgi:SAM-dependent methyltransferase